MEGYNHVIAISVRSRDIDAWGHVNNAVYFTYLEQARVEYLMRVVLETDRHGPDGIAVILAEACCQFKRPITYGQSVLVGTRAVRLGRSSLRLEHRIEADGELAATGHSVVVHYDYKAGHSVPMPDVCRIRIQSFERRVLC